MNLLRSRRILRSAGLVALAAMLFAQAAVALASCELIRATPSHAVAMSDADSACHEPPESANLCLAHCQDGDQTLDKAQVKLPAPVLDAVLVVPQRPSLRKLSPLSARSQLPAVGPPPRILLHSFLI